MAATLRMFQQYEMKASFVYSMASDTGVTVLVVDDNQDIRETVRLTLEDEGYTVLEAGDGHAALDMLRESPVPLVVLLDQIMPGMDGTATLGMIGRDERLARRHAYVMMTADSTIAAPEIVTSSADLAVPLVSKPFDIDDLLDAVAQAAGSLHECATQRTS